MHFVPPIWLIVLLLALLLAGACFVLYVVLRLGGGRTLPVLRVETAGGPRRVRGWKAAMAAVDHVDNETETLILAASRQRNTEARADAVAALGYVNSDRAFTRLGEVLREDESARTRALAALSLGLMRRPQALPLLQVSVERDEVESVRGASKRAIEALVPPPDGG